MLVSIRLLSSVSKRNFLKALKCKMLFLCFLWYADLISAHAVWPQSAKSPINIFTFISSLIEIFVCMVKYFYALYTNVPKFDWDHFMWIIEKIQVQVIIIVKYKHFSITLFNYYIIYRLNWYNVILVLLGWQERNFMTIIENKWKAPKI